MREQQPQALPSALQGIPRVAAAKRASTCSSRGREGQRAHGPACLYACPDAKFPATFVVMVPASRVVVLKDLGGLPGVEDVVHLVLLSPGQRLTQGLSGFVYVEVPGAQEPENMLIFRDLLRVRDVSKQC